jgi:tetratricopeptide (TPR) repeat protein
LDIKKKAGGTAAIAGRISGIVQVGSHISSLRGREGELTKRFSSTQGWLGYALKLARKGRRVQAQRVVQLVAKRELTSSDLRMAAQVNTRCEMIERAEECWLEVQRRHEMEPGDYYMLGSLQTRMSKLESAAQCFEREIALASSAGTDYFLGSAVIRLADLMLRLNNPSRAKEVLHSVGDGVGDHIDGVGFRTKTALLCEAEERLNRARA